MFQKLLEKIAGAFKRENIPYMIIGGQAVLLYGSPRLTRDIDITIGIDTDQFPLVEKLCQKLKLKMLPQDPQRFAQETHVLPVEETILKVRVDFIFSFTPYERQAMKRAKKVLIDGYSAKFASVEDIVVHKILAGRAIDLEDVKNILLKNRKIDFKYIKQWLSEFDQLAEQKGILRKFQNLITAF